MSPAGSGNCLYIALKWAFQGLFCEKYPYLFEDTDHQAMKMRVLLESQLESIGNVLSEDGVPLRMLLMECENEEELQCKIKERVLPGTQGDFATIQSASNCFNAEIQLVMFSQDGSISGEERITPWSANLYLENQEEFKDLFQKSHICIKLGYVSSASSHSNSHYMLIQASADSSVAREESARAREWIMEKMSTYEAALAALLREFPTHARPDLGEEIPNLD